MNDRGDESAKPRVLVADDEESMRHFLQRSLERRGFFVEVVAHAEGALAALARDPFDVLLTDVRMPGMDGHELFERVRALGYGTRIVLMTAFGSVDRAVAALKAGAENYLTKPFETDELVLVIERAAEKARLQSENHLLRSQLEAGSPGLIGRGPAMRRLFRLIGQVAQARGTVLVTGESGTGKELVARTIHACSSRSQGPFVAVPCGALPESLVEASLFGVAAGAYTGAAKDRAGYVERAASGTLFLDEIAEIPLALQPALLRFLEDGEVARVGEASTTRWDTRVVAATHKDLREEVECGRFRADLFFRLDVLPVRVPALRERPEDIPLLVKHFLDELGRPDLLVPPHVLADLQGRPWRGNVRELRNAVERMAAGADGGVLECEALDAHEGVPALGQDMLALPYRQALQGFERRYIEDLLRRTKGNVSEAARLGGLARPSLHARLGSLGIDPGTFRT